MRLVSKMHLKNAYISCTIGSSKSGGEPGDSGAESSSLLPAEAAADETNEPVDEREDIKRKFLVGMPQDFYDFWEFAKNVNSRFPSGQFCFIVTQISQSCVSCRLRI